MRLTAVLLVAGLLLLGGCGDDDGGAPSPTQRDQWDQMIRENHGEPAPDFEGHKVWVNEKERTVYIEDCTVAKRATKSGARYGPGPRDPQTQQQTREGYGSICSS